MPRNRQTIHIFSFLSLPVSFHNWIFACLLLLSTPSMSCSNMKSYFLVYNFDTTKIMCSHNLFCHVKRRRPDQHKSVTNYCLVFGIKIKFFGYGLKNYMELSLINNILMNRMERDLEINKFAFERSHAASQLLRIRTDLYNKKRGNVLV